MMICDDLLGMMKKFEEFNDFFLKYYGELSAIRDNIKKNKYPLKELIDFIYVIRTTSEMFNDLRKEASGVEVSMINVACLLYLSRGKDGPIRGDLATGTPNVTMSAKIPSLKKDPDNFIKLMEYFGIPASPIKEGILKPYWPGLCEHISKCATEGKPLPPGIQKDSQYPVYKMQIRNKVDIINAVESAQNGGDNEVNE